MAVANIDSFVTYRIPPLGENDELRNLVTTLMQHTCSQRCVRVRPNGSVIQGCKWGFPKPPCAQSHIDDKGAVVLRRTEEERHTVNYNAALLLRYKAHINVEYTPYMSNPMYIIKYVVKEGDFAHNPSSSRLISSLLPITTHN